MPFPFMLTFLPFYHAVEQYAQYFAAFFSISIECPVLDIGDLIMDADEVLKLTENVNDVLF